MGEAVLKEQVRYCIGRPTLTINGVHISCKYMWQFRFHAIITIEDYHQNLEVVYSEQPTSMAYSSNKLTVTVYHIRGAEFQDLNSSLKKGELYS